MAYDIKVPGFRDPVREEDHMKGLGLKRLWEKYKLGEANNQLIEISNWTGMLSDIGSFYEVQTRAKFDHVVVDTQKEFLQTRREFLSKGIEHRANSMDFFRFFYWGFTKKKSEEVMVGDKPIEDYAKAIQLKFFKENPKRACCEPVLFKPLIKASKCNLTVLSVIENQLYQDRFFARQ